MSQLSNEAPRLGQPPTECLTHKSGCWKDENITPFSAICEFQLSGYTMRHAPQVDHTILPNARKVKSNVLAAYEVSLCRDQARFTHL